MSLLPTIGAIDQDTGFYNGVATQSLRFNDDDDAYLSRTPAGATNRQTWTYSTWFKIANTSASQTLFSGGSAATGRVALYMSGGKFITDLGGTGTYDESVALFRDPSAWYHLVWAFDTTQVDGSNRSRIYINGTEITLTKTRTWAKDTNYAVNNNTLNVIGGFANAPVAFSSDAYHAETNFVDGTQLTPSSFGETKNGVWIPIEYEGSYGTNGFRLQFASTTHDAPASEGDAETDNIGADSSGENNHWTASDSIDTEDCNMPDSPENNFSTWNPLFKGGEQSSSIAATSTLSEGNLQVSVPTNSYMGNTFRPTSGKWYCEIRVKTVGSTNGEIDWGWIQATTYAGTTAHSGQANKWGAYYHAYSTDHIKVYDETSQLGSNINLTISAGSVLQLAWDIDNNKGWIGIDDTYYAADNGDDGDPSNGTNQTFTFTADEAQNLQCYIANGNSTDVHVANFGQDSTFGGDETATSNSDANGIGAFHHAPPSGYLALCTSNLEEPTIGPNSGTDEQADDYFNTFLYTGDDNANRGITGVGFQPDWLWIKTRNATNYHFLFDSPRGVTKKLFSNESDAEGDATGLDSFDSTGFTVDHDAANEDLNASAHTYVSWGWKAGGEPTEDNDAGASAVPKTGSAKIDGSNATASFAGTIPVTRLSANTTSGFSIVTYTGTGSAGTINHGLSATPNCIIVMGRSVSNTNSYIQDGISGVTDPFTDYIAFGNVNGVLADDATMWDDTPPDGNVFKVGTGANTNQSTKTYVAYLFSNVDGYSKFGSYTGNGAADGTFVFTGFRPAWLMIKKSSAGGTSWQMYDNKRDIDNVVENRLIADGSNTEGVGLDKVDFLSNGFKLRENATTTNFSATYIYMAFAEAPFKYANAR